MRMVMKQQEQQEWQNMLVGGLTLDCSLITHMSCAGGCYPGGWWGGDHGLLSKWSSVVSPAAGEWRSGPSSAL